MAVLFLGMTLWKLFENHLRQHGKLTWKALRNMDHVSPLLLAFVRDGSIFFALYVTPCFVLYAIMIFILP